MRRQARRIVLAVMSVAAIGVVGVLSAQRALGSLGVSDATGKQIVEQIVDLTAPEPGA